jgi:UDP-glucuronate decarboxylase
MKFKTVLISGGAGFLGSYLCDHYVSQGSKVIAVDNLSTGSLINIKHLESNQNFTFIDHDIVKKLPSEIQNQKYDLIINMASPASPPQYQRLAIETLEVGSTGTKNMLDLAKRDNARFFQASTSEVYGDPNVHPQPESYNGSVNSYGPRSMYDESKRYAEALIFVYKNQLNVDTTIARFFNTYGPRMDANDGRVVSNLIVQALEGKALTIYGDGSQTRSFCFVDDLIRGIVALIDSNEQGPMNLGNPGEFTIKELAELVIELTGSSSQVVYKPLPIDDPLQRQPDISYAKKSLSWEPKIQLREGLQSTIQFFKDNSENKK